ncbi:glyoxylase-like metal-dependent hydrolase (beta-lactamase superfamily II) [Psychrobacter luti]|uniref:Glyoxylase-like metal-dependent hydrolase (Beta-lactamase superfamily II) n=1 Tax=Psychrobacter luti TaxID=198481 RepID=A0A839TF20_9GAMM|nr:MBL fold metallo-hydrolase [Psychrobacter luti]MBB3107006.1 glyoxylase-like metal-dependent hydrolase (beta-lactamase superfamily II) [Psychrobacter luti]
MQVHSFLHSDTETYTHVLADVQQQVCAIIDPVLDFDAKSGRTDTASVDKVIAFVREQGWALVYIIETHAHADHISAAIHVKETLGGKLVIGQHITEVQKIFKQIFNFDTSFRTDASQFDILTDDGETLALGGIMITAMYVPGHTRADMAYLAADDEKTVVFVGDTLFAPDVGTARCDFPGGDAKTLYQSIQKLLALPDETMMYLCHDYPSQGRKHCPTTTVAAQKLGNIHVKDGINEAEFVEMRERRDANLEMPRLIIPSVQLNIDAGHFPKPEDNGTRYLKVPINAL